MTFEVSDFMIHARKKKKKIVSQIIYHVLQGKSENHSHLIPQELKMVWTILH